MRLLPAVLGLAIAAVAQPPNLVKGTPPPTHVLYQLLFRQIMALQAQANALDASAKAGGRDLRTAFQKELRLTDADTAIIKVVAGTCVQLLDAQDAKAKAVISTAKAAVAAAIPARQSTLTAAALTQLNSLEKDRTAISSACIQNLQHNLPAQTFARIDLYVNSVIGSKTHPVPVASTSETPTRTTGQAVKK
jgi:hypothetical protein